MIGTPETMTDRLRGALAALRLDGAIFFRAEFTESWSYESPPPAELAAALSPGRQRLAMFHIVSCGRMWIDVAGQERHWAAQGDVVVLPYGDQHRVGGTTPTTSVPITSLLEPPPWTTLPVLRYGSGGDRADMVCGYLSSDDPLFDPSLAALPPVFVVSPPAGPAADWVRASIDFAVDASMGRAPDDPLVRRLPELLVTEVLRLHLATVGAGAAWVAALRDPIVAPAMAAIHAAPEQHWTVADLAQRVQTSRSVLDQRFRELLGRPPIRYLTDWRMHLAGELLRSTDLGVGAVARRVGYDSEEAFSRAFKRHHGTAPGQWRRTHR